MILANSKYHTNEMENDGTTGENDGEQKERGRKRGREMGRIKGNF